MECSQSASLSDSFQRVFPESLFVVPTQDLLILEMPRKHEFTGPSNMFAVYL